MACDFCRGLEEERIDRFTGASVSVEFDRLRVTDRYGNRYYVPITFCPMCGQDLREVMNADS